MTKTQWYKVLEIYGTKTGQQREDFRFKFNSSDNYASAMKYLKEME